MSVPALKLTRTDPELRDEFELTGVGLAGLQGRDVCLQGSHVRRILVHCGLRGVKGGLRGVGREVRGEEGALQHERRPHLQERLLLRLQVRHFALQSPDVLSDGGQGVPHLREAWRGTDRERLAHRNFDVVAVALHLAQLSRGGLEEALLQDEVGGSEV